MIHQFLASLDSCISNLAHFLRVELGPLLIIKFFVEVVDISKVLQINECVAHVALVDEINGQVEEVELIIELHIELLNHHLLTVLVRNILDHQTTPSVLFLRGGAWHTSGVDHSCWNWGFETCFGGCSRRIDFILLVLFCCSRLVGVLEELPFPRFIWI